MLCPLAVHLPQTSGLLDLQGRFVPLPAVLRCALLEVQTMSCHALSL